MSIRRETHADDQRRTRELLDALDAMTEAAFTPLDDFERTVLFGVAGDPALPYPPAGHTYPKRG